MRKKEKFSIGGLWTKADPARAICHGIILYKPITSGSLASSTNKHHTTYAGVAGGYCGGDLFALEQFVAEVTKIKVRSLWLESQDLISGAEVDFNSLPPSVLDTCQEALEECWEWMSENNYLESRQLRLYPYNLPGLIKSNTSSNTYYKPINKDVKNLWGILHQGLGLTGKSKKIPLFKPLEKTCQPSH